MKKNLPPQFSSVQYQRIILYSIHFHKQAGIKEIAKKLNTSQNHAKITIDRMEKDGLVSYKRGSKCMIVELTEKGLVLLKDQDAFSNDKAVKKQI
jgi:DNA-binding MarR family transcriptional regulator